VPGQTTAFLKGQKKSPDFSTSHQESSTSMMINILTMSSRLVLILLVGRSVSMNFPQSSPRLSYRGNDLVMGIEGLPHLPDEEAGMATPRTVMSTLPTQSGVESSSHHQGKGSELVSIRIDAAAGERKAGLDRFQSEKQISEAQAAGTLSNGAASPQVARSGSRKPEPNECSICLNELDPSNPSLIEAWPICGHVYHTGCIQKWEGTCPICRTIDPERTHVVIQADEVVPHHQITGIVSHPPDRAVECRFSRRSLCAVVLLSLLIVFGALLDHLFFKARS